MAKNTIPKRIADILRNTEFISIATSDSQGNPSAVSKFLLKVKGDFIYLVDFIKGITWSNIKNRPKVSLSVIDNEKLISFQINGCAKILEKGPEYKILIKELLTKETSFSTRRVIEGVHRAKTHKSFELPYPKHTVILKIKINEVVKLGPATELKPG